MQMLDTAYSDNVPENVNVTQCWLWKFGFQRGDGVFLKFIE